VDLPKEINFELCSDEIHKNCLFYHSKGDGKRAVVNPLYGVKNYKFIVRIQNSFNVMIVDVWRNANGK
jgi:hypothetical protein